MTDTHILMCLVSTVSISEVMTKTTPPASLLDVMSEIRTATVPHVIVPDMLPMLINNRMIMMFQMRSTRLALHQMMMLDNDIVHCCLHQDVFALTVATDQHVISMCMIYVV